MAQPLKAVIFDFGGVLAEEGFRDGLLAIGRKYGADPERFRQTADDLIHETGYVTGAAEEAAYWDALRTRTGINGSNVELRREILSRFVLRPEVLAVADGLRGRGYITAVLSDQTNWLDELDRTTPFLRRFDRVFNSYRLRKSKRDPSVFDDVCEALGVNPGEALFIDDNPDNVRRAAERGLRVILFTGIASFIDELERLHLDRR
jgi:putative hydrolase of the HAD superfamily